MRPASSAQGLMLKLAVYFTLMFGALVAVSAMKPELVAFMPFGGTDAIEIASFEFDKETLAGQFSLQEAPTERPALTVPAIGRVALFLALTLGGTVLVMLPITWTYIATKREIGYRKNFARALIVLPICATTIVLLIQNNLALAFGLAAMVAAVRFRVALQEAIDGIYIFSSICVGLAAGIGFLGIAMVMALFFCFVNALLWHFEFGQNPIDDARAAKKNAAREAL
jgi:hypothetical protein